MPVHQARPLSNSVNFVMAPSEGLLLFLAVWLPVICDSASANKLMTCVDIETTVALFKHKPQVLQWNASLAIQSPAVVEADQCLDQ